MRLPNTAFKALAGTEVTADILFLQKRDHIVDQDVSWLHTGTNADGIPMNQYFIDHPEMICGKMEMVSGPYGMRPTCQPDTSTTLEEQLQAAMGRLNATLVKAEPVILEQQPEEAATLPADTDVRNYSYCIRDDRIFFRTDSVMREVIVNATAQARIKGMVSILATTRELIQAQLDDLPDETIAQLQRRLNQEYDAYTEKHGRLSSRANALAMREDSGYSLLCSLEIYDDDRNFKAKSDMFTKRTIRPNLVIDHVETASEALMLSVQERTSVDLSYMEQLTGKPRDELLQELTGVVFRVPGETTAAGEPLYQTGEEYLSGDVRKKLATAEIFAQQDPSYQVNVDSLRGVQPKDLTASEIELHLGTTWIPPEDIKQFILETMEPNRWAAQSIKVSYNRLNATWNIEGSSVDSYSLKATTTFGTKRKNFYEILRCSLNLQAVKVVDYIEDVDGKKKAVPNVKETRLAQDKQQQIETAFKDWIYRDPVRRRRYLCRCSNGQRKAFPSFSHMATVLHMAIGTVQTAIKSLMAAGRLLKAAFRAGKHNLYILVETVAQALPGANPGAQKENRRAGTRRQKIEMLLASIASLISNSKILHEIGACQEVLLVFLKRVCQNLRNSNKTNLTYSTKERYFSLSRLATRGEVRLSELPGAAAEVGIHGKVPCIQAEGFRVCSAFRAHGLPDRCARLFFSLYCHYSRCHQRR